MDSNAPAPEPRDPFSHWRAYHALVLERARQVEQAMLGPGEQPVDEPLVRSFVAQLGGRFLSHMQAEEVVLYPWLAERLPEIADMLVPLLADHSEMRGMHAALQRWLEAPGSPARDEQFRVLLRDAVDLLRLHVHREEAVVLDLAVRMLSGAEIAAVMRPMDQPPGTPPHSREHEGHPGDAT